MMMVLGLFVFTLKTIPYQQLQLQKNWRHASNNRVGLRPTLQYLGPDNDTITLTGVLLPEITGGRLSLLALELMAEMGRAWPLLSGSGTIYGMFVVESLSRTESDFFSNGTARRIEFTLTLRRADESVTEMLGSLGDQLAVLQSAAGSAAGKITGVAGGLFQ
jgi:phage protein U